MGKEWLLLCFSGSQEPRGICISGILFLWESESLVWTHPRWAVLLLGCAQIKRVIHWVGELQAERVDWLCFQVNSFHSLPWAMIPKGGLCLVEMWSHSSEAPWLIACGCIGNLHPLLRHLPLLVKRDDSQRLGMIPGLCNDCIPAVPPALPILCLRGFWHLFPSLTGIMGREGHGGCRREKAGNCSSWRKDHQTESEETLF